MIAKDIKTGHIVNFNEAPCMIESITVQSPSARGRRHLLQVPGAEPDHQAEG